jgi:hypothetical protein
MSWSDRVLEPLRRRVIAFLARLLAQPLRTYEQRIPNDVAALKAQLRPGDVILVEGDQRISQVIRYLTQSSWSHSAMYIGDELRRLRPDLAESLVAEHGAEASFLVIEALETGVTCAPITKYTRHNIRVCRPRGLRREDVEQILHELVGQLGKPYNVRHVLDLARYLFPVSLIPRRYRRAALRHGGELTEVICSTMLARALAQVGFPILPRVTLDEVPATGSWLRRLARRPPSSYRALYQKEDPALITPRDFDLSPYFDIVKFNHATAGRFDYRRITWADPRAEAPPQVVVAAMPGETANEAETSAA